MMMLKHYTQFKDIRTPDRVKPGLCQVSMTLDENHIISMTSGLISESRCILIFQFWSPQPTYNAKCRLPLNKELFDRIAPYLHLKSFQRN